MAQLNTKCTGLPVFIPGWGYLIALYPTCVVRQDRSSLIDNGHVLQPRMKCCLSNQACVVPCEVDGATSSQAESLYGATTPGGGNCGPEEDSPTAVRGCRGRWQIRGQHCEHSACKTKVGVDLEWTGGLIRLAAGGKDGEAVVSIVYVHGVLQISVPSNLVRNPD